MAHRHLLYYHPQLGNLTDVRNLMTNYQMKDGCFILRNSISKPGVLTVTVTHGHSIKHFNLYTKDNMYKLQDLLFDTVDGLIYHYGNHDVPNEENVRHLRLVHPIMQRNGLTSATSPPPPRPPPTSGSEGRKMSSRSFSVVSAPVGSFEAVQHAHRRSMDSNMISNGSMSGGRDTMGAAGTKLPLPKQKPKKKEHRSLFGFISGRARKKSSSSDVKFSSPSTSPLVPHRMDSRLPQPLPNLPDHVDNGYYSVVNPEDVDRSSELMEHISKFERPGDDRCECGLTFEESELPACWTMHLSQDPNTYGALFFMGPSQETEWKLPFDVSLQLTADQQDNIKKLMLNPDRNKRSSSGSSGSTGVSSYRMGSIASAGGGGHSFGRQATEHECSSSDEVFPAPGHSLQ